MDVRFVAGEAYEGAVRGHPVLADQPAEAGGQDAAPAPTELVVASLATPATPGLPAARRADRSHGRAASHIPLRVCLP